MYIDGREQCCCNENVVGKEEIVCSKCFLRIQKIVSPFVSLIDIISLFVAESGEPKIGI